MTKNEPNSEEPQGVLKRLLWVSGLGAVFFLVILGRPSELFDDTSINFWLRRPFQSFSPPQISAIQKWLLIDFVFAGLYTLYLLLLCRKGISHHDKDKRLDKGDFKYYFAFLWERGHRVWNIGRWCGWAILLFGASDVIENCLLWAELKNKSKFAILDVLRLLKWAGPLVGVGFFIIVHPRRITILRFVSGIAILLVALGLVTRLVCHVEHFAAIEPPSPGKLRLHDQIKSNLVWTMTHLSAFRPANVYEGYASNLDASAKWIRDQFAAMECMRFNVIDVTFEIADSNRYSFGFSLKTQAANVVAEKPGSVETNGIIIIGAHYDTMAFSTNWTGTEPNKFAPHLPGTSGANDNASGVAALLEIARSVCKADLKHTVRFVAFADEEPPFFQKPDAMGSWQYAKKCRDSNEVIMMMISLDTLAVYDSTNRSSYKRAGLKGVAASWLGLRDQPDYVAFMSNWDASSGGKTKQWASVFSKHSSVPVRTVSLPFIAGEIFAWSDDWSFTRHGFPAFTVTDTAFYRSPRYHNTNDVMANLSTNDFQTFAAVVMGLSEMIEEMATK